MISIKRKGAMLLMASGGLYRRVKAISTSGVQFINTGYNLNSESTVKMHTYYYTVLSSAPDCSPFGARYAYEDRAFNLFLPANGDEIYACYGNVWKCVGHNISAGDYYLEAVKNVWNLTKDGTSILSHTFAETQFTIGYPALIGRLNNSGTPIGAGEIDIGEVEMYDDNYSRHFVPVVRISDNKPGMLDLDGNIYPITGTPFFTNAYSEEGRDIDFGWVELDGTRILPKIGFTTVKYLESNNKQYIDTGIFPTNDTGIEIDFQYKSPLNDGFHWLLGSTVGHNKFTNNTFYLNGYGSTGTFSIGDNTIATSAGIVQNQRQSLSYKNNILTNCSGDVFHLENTAWASPSKYSIYLFTNHCGYSSTDLFCACSVYELKMYDGNTLVRNFVPSLDTSSRPCMLDVLHNVAYYNIGSGEFGYETLDGTYVAPT